MVNLTIHKMGRLIKKAGFPKDGQLQRCSVRRIMESITGDAVEELKAAITRANEDLALVGWEFMVGKTTFGKLVRIKGFPKKRQSGKSGAETVLKLFISEPLERLREAIALANEDITRVGWIFRLNPNLV